MPRTSWRASVSQQGGLCHHNASRTKPFFDAVPRMRAGQAAVTHSRSQTELLGLTYPPLSSSIRVAL
ncbi:hypothetical protein GWI33_000135 [Rhynchophorus ferrugineus]|uniref:Uncharacterized protein n=1 Tax=Rhynchophorus ferrugineus TaxID=354439 RepID=A0A834IYW4_RHYFE|nr:hypothetical protein GWI33_000135 [Rhynchophorus ferrugineus]